MAYLFQSGTLQADNVRYQLEADTGAINSTGSITFGAGNDASVYYNDEVGLALDTKTGEKVQFRAGGTDMAHASSDGLIVSSGKGFYVDTDKVLYAGNLGSTILASSLTSVGTIGTGVWEGTAVTNANLANSAVSYGGVSLSLGGTDATPAFNLSDATAYPGDSSLVTVGTITNGTWSGTAIVNAKLANSTISGVALGASLNALTAPANSGVSVTSYNGSAAVSDLAVDVDDLTAVTAIVTGDTFVICQQTETDDPTKKITIDHIATKLAGSGITATAGVLSVSADSTSINAIGDAADDLDEGMNYGTTTFTAARIWTLLAASAFVSAGDIVRIKAPALAGYSLTVAVHATDQVDDLANGVDLVLNSDNSSITLQCVDATAAAGKWRII